MIKILRFSIFFVFCFGITLSSYGQFPYTESFRSSTANGILFGGAPSAFLTASGSSANGGTPIDANGSGYLRLTNAALNQKGYAYSTSDFPSSNGLKVEFEYCIYGGTGADGISFFLFDATASPFTIGGFGGSLGYAQITTTQPTSPGVSKGYLAIGLDEFGNFSNPNEGRQGGTAQVPGSITLRGKGNGTDLLPNNYRFLVSQQTDIKGVSLVGDGTTRVIDPTSPSYRRVYIELIPNPSGGYNINVKIAKGGPSIVYTTIIDNYYYPDIAPENLRYGFASSTGANTNFHEIRNVAIDLYSSDPVAINDIANLCSGTTALIDVTANDRTIINRTIDKTTVDLNPSLPGIQNTLALNGKGTFSVNSSGILQFVPVSGFTGTASISYTVKDSGGATSTAAAITLNYSAPPVATNAGTDQLLNITTSTGSYVLQGNNPNPNTGVWTQISGPNNAVFTSSAVYNTTANNLTGGAYVFRWTVTSPAGCVESDDVQITVNRNPIAYNDAANTSLNTSVPIGVLNNDIDEDGNPTINKSSIIIQTQPTNGTLSINYTTGIVTYFPNTGYSGTDVFQYTVKDTNGAESNAATVTVSVNKALVGVDDVATTLVNTPVVIRVLDNDPKKNGADILKISDPANGSIVINSDGTITYTPVTGFSGKNSFSYKLTNTVGDESDPVTVSVIVKPTGQIDAGNTITNTSIIIPVKDNDLGKTGTTVNINIPPSNGTASVNGSGNVIYIPAPGFSGKDTFNYFLQTPDGVNSDLITVNVTVKPIGTPDAVNLLPNTSVMIPLKDNDISKAGTSVILITNPTNGTATPSPDGMVVYLPNSGFSGRENFTYLLRTADGVDSDPINVNITIKPVGATDYVNTITNAAKAFQVKDNDLSKSGTVVDISTTPSNGTLSLNSAGNAIYTPAVGFSGKDLFTYILSTSDGLSSDAVTVNVLVKPVGSPDIEGYNVNTPANIAVKDNDLSKGSTTVMINTNPANGTATVNSSGVVTYTPTTGFNGTDSFTYLLRTADGIDSDPITVTVTPISTKPSGSPDIANTTTNTSVTIPVKDNDASQTGTTVIIGSNPTDGTVTLNGSGIPVYTPEAGFSGKDTFTYKLRNGGGIESDPITVTVNVKPVGTINEVTTPAATTISIAVKDNDLSKTGTTVIITTSPTNGTIAVNAANEVLYTPSSTFSGKDNLTYRLRTADGLESDPINVLINVKPVGSPDNEGYNLNTPKAITVKDNDLSKLNTTVVITSNPANGTVAVNGTGIITYTPTTGFNGTNTFTYILRTADGLDSDPITVTVTPITPQPAGSADIANTFTNTPITIPVKENDVSKVGTTVIVQDNPANGTVVINGTGDPVYTPANGFSGKDTFTYKLRNTSGGLESAPITVTVNVRPSGSPDNGIFTINTPLAIDVKNNDLSKANTTVVINSNPANGSVTVSGSNVTYTPNPGYVGNDAFTYLLRTADGLNSDPINVTVSAVPLPVRPSGSPDIATTPTNIAVTIPIKDNDASKAGTTTTIQTTPTHGTVTITPAGEAVYTPTTGFAGKDTFTYVLRDNNGLESDPISVTVNVKPVGTNDNATTPVNKPVTINIKNNDLSKAGTTPIINTNPEHGTVTIDAGGNAVYTPATGYTGTDSFTYRLKTADNIESDPIVVIITVTPASQVPDITVTLPTDKPVVIDIPVPPGGSVVITNPPKHGTITIDPVTGKPIYTPNPGYTGTDDFTYVIKDEDGNESSPGKVNITVVNPAKIGLAKALVSSIKGENNTFKLTYIFTLKNYGDAAINQLSLIDNLATAFPARIFTISKLTGSGTLRVNPGFNGTSSTEMLLASSTLSANTSETVELEVTLTVNQQSGTFLNTATVLGKSVGDGTTISDISTTGLIPDPVTPGDISSSTPTQAVILVAPDITVPVSSGQPITINIPLPPGGSVVIVNPPANGTITFDPITGLPIYTPNPGYSGPDDFTYIIKDPNGNESLPGTVNITVTTPAKIGLAKALIGNVKNIDGSFNLTYQFTLVNYGDFTIQNLALTDNLALAFPGASFEIVNISTTGELKVNTQYNGRNNMNILLPTSTLASKSKEFVEMQLRIVLDKDKATFNNFAVAEGSSANNGSITTDQSTNGFNPDPDVPGNVTPSVLTPVTLTKELLKIPGGFSPNNDGINDFFVIENSQGKKINLEIYNRWGNRVYRAKEYQNTWNGRSNEGIRIGEDLPVGTYYYIIQIAGENKRVGYITINR